MTQNRKKRTRIAAVALLGALSAASALPAHAETKADALKRAESKIEVLEAELAKQGALINKLLATQSSQKEAIEKIETRPVPPAQQPPAQVSLKAPADDDKTQYKMWPPPLADQRRWAPPGADSTILANLLKDFRWYGTLDVNAAVSNSGHGSHFSVGSGGMTASGLGIKGDKEVWDGWHVVTELEMSVDMSIGSAGAGATSIGAQTGGGPYGLSSPAITGTGNQLFARQAWLGLGNETYGYVTLGRQYSGSYIAMGNNAFGIGFYGNSGPWLSMCVGSMAARYSNSIVYHTPHFLQGGFDAYLLYTAGSENNIDQDYANSLTSVLTDDAGSGWDGALFYYFKDIPLKLAVSAWQIKHASYDALHGETGPATNSGGQFVASYDFGFATIYGDYMYGTQRGGNYENVTKAFAESEGWMFSAKIPVPHFSRHAILVEYGHLNVMSGNNATMIPPGVSGPGSPGLKSGDGTLLGIAYVYKLFDQTWLYANYGQMFNGDDSTYAAQNGGDIVGWTTAGGNPRAAMIGINTRF